MAVKRRKVKKSRRRLRKHFGGVLPAEFRFAQPEDRSVYADLIRAAAEKRAKNAPKFYHIPTRLQNWANKDTLDPNVIESLVGRYKYGDEPQKRRVLEELRTQLMINDIQANPEDYIKEYMKGKHRQHNWVKTAARLGIGTAAALGIGLAAYHWGLPGMIKGMFATGANTATEEGIKEVAKSDAGNQGIGTKGQNDIADKADKLAKNSNSTGDSGSLPPPSDTGNSGSVPPPSDTGNSGGVPPPSNTGNNPPPPPPPETVIDDDPINPKTGRKMVYIEDDDAPPPNPYALAIATDKEGNVIGPKWETPSAAAYGKNGNYVSNRIRLSRLHRMQNPDMYPKQGWAEARRDRIYRNYYSKGPYRAFKSSLYDNKEKVNMPMKQIEVPGLLWGTNKKWVPDTDAIKLVGNQYKNTFFQPEESDSIYGMVGSKIKGRKTKHKYSPAKLRSMLGQVTDLTEEGPLDPKNMPRLGYEGMEKKINENRVTRQNYRRLWKELQANKEELKKLKSSTNVLSQQDTWPSFLDNGYQSIPVEVDPILKNRQNVSVIKRSQLPSLSTPTNQLPTFVDNGSQSILIQDNGYQSIPLINGAFLGKKARIAQQQQALMARNGFGQVPFMDNGNQTIPLYMDDGSQSIPRFNTTGRGYHVTRKGRHLIRKYRRHLKKKRTKHHR